MSPAPPIKVIAHELRTPLAGILGNLSLLEHPRYQDRHPELIRSLRRSAELMALTLANIAMSEDPPEVQFEHVSLQELFDDVDHLIRPLAEGRQLTLTVSPNAPRVHGEYALLRQVLLNLLTNAVRNTEAGTVALEFALSEGQVVVTVSDTGTGVKEGHRQGLGLGLPVSAALLERHCSKLELASSPAGTRASFPLETA